MQMTDIPPTADGIQDDIDMDPNMDMIIPGLYLGKLGPASLLHVLSSILVELFILCSAFAQRNESRLRSSFGITHILSITPYSYPLDGLLVRKSIPVDDYPDEVCVINIYYFAFYVY